MRIYDIIAKKRDGGALDEAELAAMVGGYTAGTVPDYQMAAFLMAVVLRGMENGETAALTRLMAHSGEVVDLSAIGGPTVDKHSTGGVGDKTTLVCAPLAAACGVYVAKMSGRGLSHTGGTVDKLEAVPGLRTELPREAFLHQVQNIGLAVVGQSGHLAPADKKIYALRDVTATVESIPLIASSIMSKKLAAGAGAILLDVKVGSGAFMKTQNDALALAQCMVAIGEENGRRTAALITSMDAPLGCAVGNSLEVAEAVAVLRGEGPKDLEAVCVRLAAEMLALAGKGSEGACHALAQKALESGAGLEKLRQMVAAQGGDARYIDEPARFAKAPVCREVRAPQDGFIAKMDTQRIGVAALCLGAGRERKEDTIDHAAGIVLRAKTGSAVKKGDVLATLWASSAEKAARGEAAFLAALELADTAPAPQPLVLARVDTGGTVLYTG